MSTDQLWPRYISPDDLADIESIPLANRALPESTYAVLERAAALWPDRTAVSVLPDASRWQEPTRRTFGGPLVDVRRFANVLREVGVERDDAVALIAPNCDELITAILAAQLAGIAAPVNGALSADHVTELVKRSGARVLVAAAPELDTASWETARHLAGAGVVDTVLLLRPGCDRGKPWPVRRLDSVAVTYFGQAAESYSGTEFFGEQPTAGDLAALFHRRHHRGAEAGRPRPRQRSD